MNQICPSNPALERAKQHGKNYPKIKEARGFNPEELELLDIPLVLVFFPESRKKNNDCSPKSRQTNDDRDALSACFRKVQATVSSGSTLRTNQGLLLTKDKEKPFACGFCGKTYERKHPLYGHIRYNHEEKRNSCEFCGKRYGQVNDLENHMTMHTQEKPYICDQCGVQFHLPGSLRRHKYTHSSEQRLFTCQKCNKSFKSSNVLRKHMDSHNEEGVICCICNKKLSVARSLKAHMRIHTGERPFKCTECDKQFRQKHQLKMHMNVHRELKMRAKKLCSVCGKSMNANSISVHMRVHSGEKPFECSICLKKFQTKQHLEGHVRSHTGEKPFACSGCNTRFSSYSNMITHKAKCNWLSENVAESVCDIYIPIHMRTHSGEKPFECSICLKKFPKKQSFEGHMRSHTGEKPFACSGCDKTFALYSNMMTHKATHMRMHSGEKPFECNICLKKFPRKKNLEGHMRCHTGEKPFACSGCDKKFANYSNMMTHNAKCTKSKNAMKFRIE